MKKFMHIINGEEVVHYDGSLGDSALCGQGLDGDEVNGDIWSAAEETKKRVNCEMCIQIVRHVRGI